MYKQREAAFLDNFKREMDGAWVEVLVQRFDMPRRRAERVVALLTDEQVKKLIAALSLGDEKS